MKKCPRDYSVRLTGINIMYIYSKQKTNDKLNISKEEVGSLKVRTQTEINIQMFIFNTIISYQVKR